MNRNALVILVMLVVGCATVKPSIDQRSLAGPTAQQLWTARVLTQMGRDPTFEERQRWSDEMDRQISRYLVEHPEVANSSDVTTFRYEKQPIVGMTKEQVLILLGAPESVTADQAQLEILASRFWPQIKADVTEAWVYPLGWRFFFGGPRLTAITQYLSPNE
jgi:hypothetical protein